MDERSKDYAAKLSELIKYETISVMGDEDLTKFHEFQEVLKGMFPLVFDTCEFEEYNGSFLLRWKGPFVDKSPILLMNHHDVVETKGEWIHPPFSGDVAEDKVWGRGTLDAKGGLFAMLQAAEELIAEGFVPNRDIYFESSCNEETSGAGADIISQTLRKRGVHFYMVLDGGGMILHEPVWGADAAFAMIGVGEKGCADLKFTARGSGGQAATPGKNTPLVRLGRFMAAVEDNDIFETKVSDTVREMFSRMAPTMTGAARAVLGHVDFFDYSIRKHLPDVSGAANAMLKTTIAFTMAQGSEGTNVLPHDAWVIGNMRYSHHQGARSSIETITKLAIKYGITVEVLDPGFESPLADFNDEPFKLLERAITSVFANVIPCPYVLTTASDARYFSRVSYDCLRFIPFRISDKQMESMHGINECVDVSALAPAVDFYKYIIKEV